MQFEKPVSNTDKILDVGCGSGVWLAKMAQAGYGNLHGCDPFLSQERHYGDRVYIRNCSIHEMDGDNTFDFIRMNDSFEHMTDPYEALQSAKRLLKLGGVLRMSIPTYPNIAFEMFGPHWYQLDAPRHIFLHSMKSLSYLSEKAGLPIVKIEYDSNDSQFVRSFFYERGVPFWEQTSELVYKYFQKEDILHMADTAAAVNAKGYGDHVKVWLQKIGE